jgi:hypothetical protein
VNDYKGGGGFGPEFDEFLRRFPFARSTAPRPQAAAPTKPGITVQDLVQRGTSIVRLGDKTYRITAKEVEVTK